MVLVPFCLFRTTPPDQDAVPRSRASASIGAIAAPETAVASSSHRAAHPVAHEPAATAAPGIQGSKDDEETRSRELR
jgi:hypothetical protein